MSQLKLFRPQHDTASGEPADPHPVIYSISSISSISATRLPVRAAYQRATLARARAIHANRTCPDCGRTTVVPLEFQDAALNRNLVPVPGTATLAGFACHACGAEWSL
jgi:hypothetical protein